MSIICSCLCHAASVVSVPAMPLAPAVGGWTPPRAPPPPPPYSITAAAPYSALSLLPSAVLRRSQHGAGPLDAARSPLYFPRSFSALFLLRFPSPFHPFSLFVFSSLPRFLASSLPGFQERVSVSFREKGYLYAGRRRRNTGDPDRGASKRRSDERNAAPRYPFRFALVVVTSAVFLAAFHSARRRVSSPLFSGGALNPRPFEDTPESRFLSPARARLSPFHTKNSSYVHAHSRRNRFYVFIYIYLLISIYILCFSRSLCRLLFLYIYIYRCIV